MLEWIYAKHFTVAKYFNFSSDHSRSTSFVRLFGGHAFQNTMDMNDHGMTYIMLERGCGVWYGLCEWCRVR